MVNRIKFKQGEQRKFIQKVLEKINCPSLRELGNRLNLNYSTLKNYFVEERLISEELFNELIEVSVLNKKDFDIQVLDEHWGQSKGGKS